MPAGSRGPRPAPAIPAASPQSPPGALYLNGLCGSPGVPVSVRARGRAGDRRRRLGQAGWRRGEPRTGHSAARALGAAAAAAALRVPARPPVTSSSALTGFRSPPPGGPVAGAEPGPAAGAEPGRRGVGWGEGAGRSVGARREARPRRARVRGAPARGRVPRGPPGSPVGVGVRAR